MLKQSFLNLALVSWNNALTYFVKFKDRSGESDCYISLGLTYDDLGDHEKAIQYYEKVLEIKQEFNDRSGESKCYTSIGNAYDNLGDSRKAIEYHEKALEIFKEINDISGESDCYANLGNAYIGLGDLKLAIEYFEKSLKIKQEINDISGESKCYVNLGRTYNAVSEFGRAIEYFEKSLKIKQEINDISGESDCYTVLGNAYIGLGDLKLAIEYFEKSLKIDKETGKRSKESSCYGNIGNAYDNLGDSRKAIEYHEKALEIFKEINDGSGESGCYANLGNAYCNLGDFSKSIKYYEKSLEIDKEIGDRSLESSCYVGLGNAYDNLGDSKHAIEYYERSLEMVRELGQTDQERLVDFNLALLYSKSNLELAYDYCKRSIQLSEIISEKLVQEDYTRGFQVRASKAYQLMVPLCLKLGKQEEAFEYVEGSKSRAFLELLAATKIKPTSELTNETRALFNDEDTCLATLREIQTRHLREKDTKVEPGETEKILQKLNSIYDEIGKFDPEYVCARRAKPLTLDNTLETLFLLKKPTVLVEYFVTYEETFIFVVSSKDKELHVVNVDLPEDKLKGYFESFEKEVMNYDPKAGGIGESWLELSDYLIKPIQSLLAGHDLIYFVPYYLLHILPLHALKLEGQPIIEKYPVVYAPSASIIKFCQNKGSGKLQTCVSLGVAREDQPLLESIVEDTANGVANLFGTEAYNGDKATKEKVLKEIEDKDVVHFSCHGEFVPEDPLSSGVILHNQEILSAREIFDLKLNAEIVTLGACQTGVSERSLGDELVGLTRSFLYAGAPSLMVSLWSVNALSTKELILEFYKLAKSGVDKATALQQAQKKTMKEYPHPYYWAPFVLVGKD